MLQNAYLVAKISVDLFYFYFLFCGTSNASSDVASERLPDVLGREFVQSFRLEFMHCRLFALRTDGSIS